MTTGEQQSQIATVATDEQGWFKAVSPGFLALIDQPVEALGGIGLIDLVHPLDATIARQLLATSSESPLAIVRLLGPNDAWTAHQMRTSPVENGRITVSISPINRPQVSPVIEVLPDDSAVAASVAAVTPATAEESIAAVTPAIADAPAAVAASTDAPGPAVVPVAPAATIDAFAPVPQPLTSAEQVDAQRVLAASSQALPANFVYADSTDDLDYAQSRPGEDVAGLRAAVRDQATANGATAMLEFDRGGRATFVTGDWNAFVEGDADGVEAFEQLLARTGHATPILQAIEQTMLAGQGSQTLARVADGSLQVVATQPIASPVVAARDHALVYLAPAPPGTALPEQSWTGSDAATPTTPVADFFAQKQAAAEPDAAMSDTEGELAATSQPEAPSADGASADDPNADVGASPSPGRSRVWVALALLALVGLLLWLLVRGGGSSDTELAADMGPVEIEIVPTEPIEVAPGQTWRPLGVGGLSDVHGIAATDNGAVVAATNGRVITLDADGVALFGVQVGDGIDTAISDVVATPDGTSWLLDAGQAQLYQVDPAGAVRVVEPTFDPLRNARGIALGSDDTVWVASTASSQILRIGRDGGLVDSIALPGRQPNDVVELEDGTLWFIDAELIELVRVNLDGETLQTQPLESFFSNEGPHLTLVGGQVWVTEPMQGSVFAIDAETGERVVEGIDLVRAGDIRVERPIGITSTNDGHIWTVDSLGRATIVVDP